MNGNLADYLETFSTLSKKPHDFLKVQEESAEHIKSLIKQLYDYTKANEESKLKNALPELIVDKFDEEQIWQELELQNGDFTNKNIQNVSQLLAKKGKLNFPLKLKCAEKPSRETDDGSDSANIDNEETTFIEREEFEDLSEDDNLGNENNSEDEDDNDNLSDDSLIEDGNNSKQKGRVKPSIVDDQFFKLSDLEYFLKNEEQNENKPGKNKGAFDLFEEIDGGAEYKYSDFFANPNGDDEKYNEFVEDENDENEEMEDDDKKEQRDDVNEIEAPASFIKPKTKRKLEEGDKDVQITNLNDDKKEENAKKKVRFSLLASDEEEISDDDRKIEHSKDLFGNSKKIIKKTNEQKSSLEQRKERLDRVIGRLEEEAMSEKPWQLKGEVSANLRPENSLLEEAVDFDISVRPAPIMTGEVTMKLEDIIMQRIKDQAWDDVERKVKPIDTPSEFKKKLVLDQEKSKFSLAEVYEQEFIKEREAATADDTERQEIEPPLHVEVRNMLHALFNKLDALSNYHYTPRPVAPELKVVSNVAAITMEEVAPVATADATLLAPQEVRGKRQKGDLMSKEERTDTDKKRARRLKKTRQRQRFREKAKMAKDISKINPGLGNKYSKLKAEQQLLDTSSNKITKMDQKQEKVVKSSSAFFTKLQDEVKSQIKNQTSLFPKKRDKKNVTAKKLKL